MAGRIIRPDPAEVGLQSYSSCGPTWRKILVNVLLVAGTLLWAAAEGTRRAAKVSLLAGNSVRREEISLYAHLSALAEINYHLKR